ncbi:hypothetical protein MUY27_08500 [Mucilaginibacter sp. RS28]|uniref:Uncharacterized protein n=1 Tax=Mucilaginibacter straminoryzae TaxID=2932774 RepID=A0A9X2BBE0_9SPHI|nr:hypothetical protein [Mucilaginibacter straminoryzae]MCJ8209747.1 hypothetical protein [Mucilaginibacter straminoryzae]
MDHETPLMHEAKAWIKRKNGTGEIIRIVQEYQPGDKIKCFKLYTAFEDDADYLGRILFDTENYWIYDGEILTVDEQEQLAQFIINHAERV